MASMGLVRALTLVLVTSACGFEVAGTSGVDAPASPEAGAPACGNHIRDPGEECDDGNTMAGDGCTACVIEPAWQCSAGSCVHVIGIGLFARETLASVGASTGGAAFSYPCAAKAAIVGFEGDASNGQTDIGHLRAACAMIGLGPDGHLTWSAVQNTQYAGNETAGGLGMTRCPSGSIVVGYTSNAGDYLSGLQPTCMEVSFVHGALTYGPPVALPMFGPATRVLQPAAQCAAGEAATVFEGKAGAVLDHFDLQCAALVPITE